MHEKEMVVIQQPFRMIELCAIQNIATGLTLVAAHVVSHVPRKLHLYCSNAVILEIADIAFFLSSTSKKAELSER